MPTPCQPQFWAHALTLRTAAGSISNARVDLNPHQGCRALRAALAAVEERVILADEVGLGKTIEARIVIAQRGRNVTAPSVIRKMRIVKLVGGSVILPF